jgi:hypothetical protein
MHVRALAGLIVFFIAVDGVTAVEHPRNPLIPPALYAVQAAPFTATIESVWQGTETAGPGRQLTKVVRDSAGRQLRQVGNGLSFRRSNRQRRQANQAPSLSTTLSGKE